LIILNLIFNTEVIFMLWHSISFIGRSPLVDYYYSLIIGGTNSTNWEKPLMVSPFSSMACLLLVVLCW